jgi:hypothetical protein
MPVGTPLNTGPSTTLVTVTLVVMVETGTVVIFVTTVVLVVTVLTGVTTLFVVKPKAHVVELPHDVPMQLAPPLPVPPLTQ